MLQTGRKRTAMEQSYDNPTEMTIGGSSESKPTSGWRRDLRFPKSWKEVKSLGWKFILAFVLFYLIRDSILYILIPYLIYKGVIGQ